MNNHFRALFTEIMILLPGALLFVISSATDSAARSIRTMDGIPILQEAA